MKYYFLLLLFLLGCCLKSGHAQNRTETFKATGTDSLQRLEAERMPVFKNINKVPYYNNSKKIKRIKKFQTNENWQQLQKELREYVENFGIENFYKDTYLLWRLAKLTELSGKEEEAKFYYQLALKHHRSDIDIKKIELHYKELNPDDIDVYVPLEYYYELVDYRQQIDSLLPPRSVLLNMGSAINSSVEDYAPTLNVHNNLLIFTSKRNIDKSKVRQVPNEDLYFSLNSGGVWQKAQPFSEINTRYNEGSATITRDGKTLYFSRCEAPDGYGNCDLYEAHLQENGSWGNIKNMGENVNSVGWDSHPSLSHTEDTLYYASDRIGGFGMSDIWFTYRNKKGEWQPSKNVGPVINTRQNELSPFLHPKHNILYFSSNGQLLNFGEFDIYKAYKIGDRWTEPKNIGPLVNGKGSEFYFTIDSDSKDLYYARSVEDNMKNLDLHSFPLPMEAQPLATTKITGSLVDEETQKPLSGIVSIIDLDTGIEVAPKYLREDGTYEFDLIRDKNYLLIIQGDNFFRIEQLFYLDGAMDMEHSTQTISKKLEFTTIDFASGSATVVPEMYPDLNKLADFLIDHPDVKLVISGHTDSDGDEASNQILSQRRAHAIMEYLTYFASVNPNQVIAIGYGSSKPIVEERTEADKRLNRRVEFELIREGQEEGK